MTAAATPSGAAPGGSTDPRVAVLFSELEPRLRQALFADADRILAMGNPHGYLYRVARDKTLGPRRLTPTLPPVRHELQPEVTPELAPALARLSPNQRTSVFLAAGLGWSWVEIAEFLGTSVSTVRNHYRRGIEKLRTEIGEVAG